MCACVSMRAQLDKLCIGKCIRLYVYVYVST